MNFKKKFPSIDLKDDFWAVSFATHGYQFWEVMKRIKKHKNGEPHDWLLEVPIFQWSRHMFNFKVKSDHMTNNMTESFNNWVEKIRRLPICKLIDAIR